MDTSIIPPSFRIIPIKYNRLTLLIIIDRADYDLVKHHIWRIIPSRTHRDYYAATKIRDASRKWHTLYMHRLIMGISNPKVKVDHISSGNGLDNRRSNLRTATASQNAANRRKRSDVVTSAYKGVTPYGERKGHPWQARIKSNGHEYFLGSFRSEQEAAAAYDAAALHYFGEFAHLNLA